MGIAGPDGRGHHYVSPVHDCVGQPTNIERKNPPVRSMADRMRDFTRVNPPIFTRSKTSEDPQEFVDEVHKILVAMRAANTKKSELTSYQLKDVAQT